MRATSYARKNAQPRDLHMFSHYLSSLSSYKQGTRNSPRRGRRRSSCMLGCRRVISQLDAGGLSPLAWYPIPHRPVSVPDSAGWMRGSENPQIHRLHLLACPAHQAAYRHHGFQLWQPLEQVCQRLYAIAQFGVSDLDRTVPTRNDIPQHHSLTCNPRQHHESKDRLRGWINIVAGDEARARNFGFWGRQRHTHSWLTEASNALGRTSVYRDDKGE
ncbi:hypothetical protein J2X84_002258 [Pseudomonas corrugata]|nr:hypothetical protein [Pseudomonas corrugata]